MIVGSLAVSIVAKTQKFRKGMTVASKIVSGFSGTVVRAAARR